MRHINCMVPWNVQGWPVVILEYHLTAALAFRWTNMAPREDIMFYLFSRFVTLLNYFCWKGRGMRRGDNLLDEITGLDHISILVENEPKLVEMKFYLQQWLKWLDWNPQLCNKKWESVVCLLANEQLLGPFSLRTPQQLVEGINGWRLSSSVHVVWAAQAAIIIPKHSSFTKSYNTKFGENLTLHARVSLGKRSVTETRQCK